MTNGLPAYRIGYFKFLLDAEIIGFTLYASKGLKTYMSRSDQISGDTALRYTHVNSSSILLFSKELVIQCPPGNIFDCDFLIVHDESKYLFNYFLSFARFLYGFKTVYFTHGKMIHGKNKYIRKLYKHFSHKPDFYLTYTPFSTDYLVRKGIRSSRIVHFMNTINTNDLEYDLGDPDKIYKCKDTYKLAFVGTLHSERRFDLVLETFRELYKKNKKYTLEVYGAGPLLEKYKRMNIKNVLFFGYVAGRELQNKLLTVSFVLNPGLIGLNIVDCIFAHTVMISDRTYSKHSPEIYYVNNFETGVLLEWSTNNVLSFLETFNTHMYKNIIRNQQSLKGSLLTESMANRTIDALVNWSGELKSQ